MLAVATFGPQGEGDGGGSSSTNGGGPECALRPLQEALDRLTKALLHEERRCRYVSREVRETLLRLPWVPPRASVALV